MCTTVSTTVIERECELYSITRWLRTRTTPINLLCTGAIHFEIDLTAVRWTAMRNIFWRLQWERRKPTYSWTEVTAAARRWACDIDNRPCVDDLLTRSVMICTRSNRVADQKLNPNQHNLSLAVRGIPPKSREPESRYPTVHSENRSWSDDDVRTFDQLFSFIFSLLFYT